MYLQIDLKNAFNDETVNNFTVSLIRLIARADSDNKEKLRLVYPAQVRAVEIYKTQCPYHDVFGRKDVDWGRIAIEAEADATLRSRSVR